MNALENTLTILEFLVHFNVSGNPIKNVDKKTFANNLKLETLSLSNCSLTEIKPGTFSSLSKLTRLDLSYNQLKTLDLNTLPLDLRNLKIAGIDSNKFNCSYLEKLFESITPQHLVAISNRIGHNCTSANNEEMIRNDSSETTTARSENNFSFDIVTEKAGSDEKTQTMETVEAVEHKTEKKHPISMDAEQNYQINDKMHNSIILVIYRRDGIDTP
ncbi:uncharacterized protein LOC129571065 [Sitodiplosis mosellana]|uniref:uncharacterized protein LOC129571065 n=1 Tax=Sitodiplosis mosellana TaxID=263140 RepID=UPI0024451FA1|nr:uncharacterized protein LOC129571065 [Sitodiplosis mosellana]